MQRAVAALTVLLVAGGLLVAVTGEADRPPEPLRGQWIPASPQQAAPWQPPASDLPEVFVSATTALFRQGLADPRGCRYREVDVHIGSCWRGDAGVATIHAWVLPAEKGQEQRFAVCWNGLVHPVEAVGKEADLGADVLAAVRADEERRTKWAKDNPDRRYYRFRHAAPEGRAIAHETLLSLKAALLLRLGEAGLAEKLWAAWTAGMDEQTNDDRVHLKDPYLMLATEWTWALFDRAVCAHMRGDDRLALASVRPLVAVWPAVEAQAERRGFRRPDYPKTEDGKPPYLHFLRPARALLTDQERRAKEPKRKRALDVGLESFPDEAARVTALIQDLEEVSARQGGQPGGVSLAGDPVVQALIRQGEDAIEPLLGCLEHDSRLTRSVHFHRDFFRHRSLIGAHEAAYAALANILKTSFFGVAATGDDLSSRGAKGRKAVAARIRAYWKRFRGVPLHERWYRTLADDGAPWGHWLQAARNIVQPVDVHSERSSMLGGWVTVPRRKPGEAPRMRGEALRQKKDPSVAELMARRVEQMVAPAMDELDRSGTFRDSNRVHTVRSASDLALALAKWDAEASRPVLRRLLGQMRRAQGHDMPYSLDERFARPVVKMTLALAKAGDLGTLDDYAAWVQRQRPKALSFEIGTVFEPMWRYPDHPKVTEAAERMFNGQSPWNPLIQTGKAAGGFQVGDLFGKPLVAMPAFRRQLLERLTDKRVAGKVAVRSDGRVNISVVNNWSTSTSALPDDPRCPKEGTEAPFRLCDVYAWLLSRLEGTPQCELFWPEAERDKAAAACAAFLTRFGSRFACARAGRHPEHWPDDGKARLTFPPLDRPATRDEARRGLAIFSLEGEGKVRVPNLPRMPIKARWTTLDDYPRATQYYDTKTRKSGIRITYDQSGFVWQAEEVSKGGRWERYYGFVGRYVVAKVPAAEIELERPKGSE